MRSAAFYDRFAPWYGLVDYFFLRKYKKALYRAVALLPPGRLLDVGVGQGRHLAHFLPHHITGIDSSMGMLGRAQKHAPKGVVLCQMDGADMEFDAEAFDIVVLAHVLSVVPQPMELLAECTRVLRKGGTLLLLNHFTPGGWPARWYRWFSPVARRFHFQSWFPRDAVPQIKALKLLHEEALDRGGAYQLLTFVKA